MSISWPVAAIEVAFVFIIGLIILGSLSSRPGSLSRSRIAAEVAKRKRSRRSTPSSIARSRPTTRRSPWELRDATSAMQSDLATMLERVNSIERMMREVGCRISAPAAPDGRVPMYLGADNLAGISDSVAHMLASTVLQLLTSVGIVPGTPASSYYQTLIVHQRPRKPRAVMPRVQDDSGTNEGAHESRSLQTVRPAGSPASR